MANTEITDDGVIEFSRNIPVYLEALDIGKNPGITDKGLKALNDVGFKFNNRFAPGQSQRVESLRGSELLKQYSIDNINKRFMDMDDKALNEYIRLGGQVGRLAYQTVVKHKPALEAIRKKRAEAAALGVPFIIPPLDKDGELGLSKQKLNDDDIEYLMPNLPKGIRTLNLSNNLITDTGGFKLEEYLLKHPIDSLYTIDLSGNNLSNLFGSRLAEMGFEYDRVDETWERDIPMHEHQ